MAGHRRARAGRVISGYACTMLFRTASRTRSSTMKCGARSRGLGWTRNPGAGRFPACSNPSQAFRLSIGPRTASPSWPPTRATESCSTLHRQAAQSHRIVPRDHKTGSPAYPTPAQRLSDKRYLLAYVFIHVERRSPRHVHVYRDGKLIVKWDLDQKAMKGAATRRSGPDQRAGG